ncbi:hypothetical protein A7981_06965 [Methylovorus sp. MM2]|uniref:NAD(P)-binding protein n=1 Tax=Methylovorus sp. MM2 TaxID=1848038 RepID=UPI0007DE6BB4|nr:NAD(P)-binding protein [Methylovorus sp. MM2]OAM53146.1 hypothetical protein A7981_06965 [Methylovorus sp. MM2]
MKPKVVIVGGGFKGIVASKYLADQGAEVVLIEHGKNLGGIHFSIPWNGFQLDLGCHVFSNEDDNTTQILLDLLGEEPLGISPVVKSLYLGVETLGIEYPDFSNYPDTVISKCLFDLLDHVASNEGQVLKEPVLEETLDEFLANRYGREVANLLRKPLMKMLLVEPEYLSSLAFSAIPARRVSLVKSDVAALLKTHPVLNELVLRSSADDPMRYVKDVASGFPHRCFYPMNGGMGGFARAATSHLQSLGVQIRTAVSIQAIHQDRHDELKVELNDGEFLACDRIFWTSSSKNLSETLKLDIDFSKTTHSVPMVLFYYDVARDVVGPYSWVQDFNQDDLTYRASTPSTFGNATAPDGRAYALAEVLASEDSEIYLNPDLYINQVWEELVKLGVTTGELPSNYKVMKTPVSYKFPTLDFVQAKIALDAELNHYPKLHLLDEWIFGKAASVKEVVNVLSQNI